ncbi:MAG: hypothetical protein HYV40_03215, partial [Candidatus Levybacteria bacterium]|nr:hypothetical protein [Candidatus Levybacteria bacterium]
SVTLSHSYAVPIHYSKLGGNKKNILISLLLLFNIPLSLIRNIWGYLVLRVPQLLPVGVFFYDLGTKTIGRLSDEKERSFLASYLNIDRKKINSYNHHLSHAAAAYYASPFNRKKALVVTADGEGDLFSATVSIFNGTKYQVISKTRREQSLGYLYAYLTEFLGMKSNEHEYKVMGLAAYAKSEDVEKLYRRIEHIVKVDRKNFSFVTTLNMTDAKRYFRTYMQSIRFDILAGAFQLLLERRICEWIQYAVMRTRVQTVILSGGVFMNVKVNQKIAKLSEVKEVFVLPSCGDESSILGSSYLEYLQRNRGNKKQLHIPPIENIYWGPSFTNDDIKKVLKATRSYQKYTIQKVDAIDTFVAKLLADGHIVARLSGRMEFGARALGNRSILADPRNYLVVRRINELIKNRDFWMPFAASILQERESDYIKNPKHIRSPYMMMTFDCTEKGKNDLPAAIHQSDFTTRPQIVTREQNSSYYRVISEFEKLTGVGAVLNTSFNLHGYPIVLGPKEALETFEKSGLTHLVLENFLVVKRNRTKKKE